MKKQKTNKVKTVVYLIHFILIDIWARNGVLHIFLGEGHARCLENQLPNQKLKSTTCAVSRKSAPQQKTYYVLKLQSTGVG